MLAELVSREVKRTCAWEASTITAVSLAADMGVCARILYAISRRSIPRKQVRVGLTRAGGFLLRGSRASPCACGMRAAARIH